MFRVSDQPLRRTFLSGAVLSLVMSIGVLFTGSGVVRAQALTEAFDVVPVPGWTTTNNSTPVGTISWFQGNPGTFPSQAGATNAYIGVNFNSTTGANTISNWLISPQRNFSNGDVIKFWTRTVANNPFPDRLQVRLSLAGASTNVGSGPTGIGDFTTLLIDINPTYNTGTGAPPALYPGAWTEITLTLSGIPAGASGRIAFRYFVEDGGPTGNNSNYIGIDTFSFTPAAANPQHVVDTDGDGRTDAVVVRNTGGGSGGQVTWFDLQGAALRPIGEAAEPEGVAVRGVAWGISTDDFVPEDYDGDGKTDIAVWRGGAPNNSFFYIINSATGTVSVVNFGQSGDDPSVVGDYDNDNKADIAIYRGGASAGQQSEWWIRGTNNNPGNNFTFIPWGMNGDFPAPGDYDGDGRNDFAVQRNAGGGVANFWIRFANGTLSNSNLFGTPTDVIVPGDYDGDGKTDLAVVRNIGGLWNWFVRLSGGGADSKFTAWGSSSTDFPVQGDYDGDGKTDQAVWRPGTGFLIRKSSGGTAGIPWGQSGDYPVANYNSH